MPVTYSRQTWELIINCDHCAGEYRETMPWTTYQDLSNVGITILAAAKCGYAVFDDGHVICPECLDKVMDTFKKG